MLRRLRSLLADPGGKVIAVAVLMIVAQLGFRAWAVYGGWFQFDDFAFMSRLMNDPVPDVFFREYAGHLMPAGLFLQWVNMRVGHLDWWLPATELLVMQALANLGLLLALLRLFGRRKGILVPLAVYLATAITMPAFIWWAAGINQLPMQIAIFWGTWAHVAYLRTRRMSWAVTTMAITIASLLFYEKGLLVFIVFAFLALAYFTTGDFFERVRQVWSRYRPGVVLYSIVAFGYAGIYVLFGLNFDPGRANETQLWPVAWNIFSGFVTGIVGGPLRWNKHTEIFATPAPSDLILALSLAVVTLVLWEISRTYANSKRAFWLPVAFFVTNTLLVAGGRASFAGPELALDYRYQTELAAVAALAIALATMPLTGATEPVQPVRRSSFFGFPYRVTAATVAVSALATVSAAQFANHWRAADSAPRYFHTAKLELAAADEPVPLVDVHVPGFLMFAYAYPESSTSHVLRMFDDQMTFPSHNVDEMYMLADDGTVQPMVIDPVRRAEVTASECPYQPRFGRIRIPLDGPVIGGGWWMRMHYGADGPTQVAVRAGESRHELKLPAGIHNVFFEVAGEFQTIEVLDVDQGVSLCVTELELGQPRPANGPFER